MAQSYFAIRGLNAYKIFWRRSWTTIAWRWPAQWISWNLMNNPLMSCFFLQKSSLWSHFLPIELLTTAISFTILRTLASEEFTFFMDVPIPAVLVRIPRIKVDNSRFSPFNRDSQSSLDMKNWYVKLFFSQKSLAPWSIWSLMQSSRLKSFWKLSATICLKTFSDSLQPQLDWPYVKVLKERFISKRCEHEPNVPLKLFKPSSAFEMQDQLRSSNIYI